ncbi:MAG: TonB-dependent receptor [Colwellia sp.]|nr:TonB-dependent receptor [Colwellia sp.]
MSKLNATNLNKHSISRVKSCAVAVQFAISNLKASHCGITVLALSMSTGAFAQQTIDIQAQPLANAVKEFAQKTGLQIAYNAKIMIGKKSSAVKGLLTIDEALKSLVKGSGLAVIKQANGSYILKNVSDSVENKNIAGTLALTTVGSESRFGDGPEEEGGLKAQYQTSATKMAMSLKETPQAISVITRNSLDLRQVDEIDQALELTSGTQGGSGFYAAPSGPFTGRGFYARQYVVRGQALDYTNGLKTDGFSAGSLARIDLAAYERVEVIKGPSGFFGSGASGGAINLVRKKPQTEFAANISSQVGSYDTYRTEADITGALTEDKDLRGRLVMAYGDEGSFVDGIATDTTIFAPSLEAIVSDNTRVLLQLLYQKEEFDVNNGQPGYIEKNRLKLFNLPRSYHYGASGNERSKVEIKDVSVRVDHELSDRWLTTLLLQRSETARDIIDGNYGYYSGGYHYVNGTKNQVVADNWAGELRLDGAFDAFGREHKILFGVEQSNKKTNETQGYAFHRDDNGDYIYADIYHDNFADFGFLAKEDISSNTRNGSKSEHINSAFYIQSVLSLTERTQLLINARYERVEYDATDETGNLEPKNNRTDNEFTLRIGVTHELNDNLSAYGSYGESFKPNIYGRDINNNPLDAQRGDGYELGLKGDWFDNKLGATLAAYRQELTNRAISHPTDRNAFIAAGLHRTDGLELEIFGAPMPGLNISAAATWMDNEFLDENDKFDGFAIEGSAKGQYSLYANYELLQGPLKGFATGMMWLHTLDQQLLPYDNNTGGYSQAYIDGYDRVDFDFSYRGMKKWDMSLVIRNIFDEKYIESGSSRGSGSQYYGAPRSVLFKMTYHFD